MSNAWDDEETLREMYLEELKGTQEIANELGCSKPTIRRRLHEYSIPIRNRAERKIASSHSKQTYERLTDRKWLEGRYCGGGESLSEIAGCLDCTPQTVANWLERHGIERRPDGGRGGKEHPNWKGGKPLSECEVCGEEFEHSRRDPGRFCSPQCSGVWKSSAWNGPTHPRWNGGYVSGYGENWEEQRTKALKRDNYECQRCGMAQEKHKEKTGKSLHVHHISNKKNFANDKEMNKLSNLVSLCGSCHAVLEGLPIDNR